MTAARPGGFTLVEVLVAILVLTIGTLGIAAETAALTRAFARARRAARVSAAAVMRLERLRATACDHRADGSEPVVSGGAAIAELRWSWSVTAAGPAVSLVTIPETLVPGPAVPLDTLRMVVSCLP